MRIGWKVAVAGAVALALAGCGREGAGAPNGDILANALVPADEPASGPQPVEAWFGRWNGPEGTFLDIANHPGGLPRVQIMLKDNLDDPAKPYIGHAEGRTIRFSRDGQELTVRPGSGAETGFKWLADKKDCLILVTGKEGYCRG